MALRFPVLSGDKVGGGNSKVHVKCLCLGVSVVLSAEERFKWVPPASPLPL